MYNGWELRIKVWCKITRLETLAKLVQTLMPMVGKVEDVDWKVEGLSYATKTLHDLHNPSRIPKEATIRLLDCSLDCAALLVQDCERALLNGVHSVKERQEVHRQKYLKVANAL